MSYCAAADVQAEFRELKIDSGSTLSTAQLTAFIAQSDAEIDSALAVKYQVPITGTQALLIVQMLSVWLTKDRIKGKLELKGGADAKTNQELGIDYRKKAMEELKAYAAGTKKLVGATYATTADGVRSFTNDNSTPNIFDVGTKQW